VFDPDRDHDPSVRTFYRRVAGVAIVTVVVCIALWPSVSGFSAGPDHDAGCVAIKDGWHSEVPAPTGQELTAAYSAMPPMPTPAQQHDAQYMNAWRAKWRTAQANATVIRANARLEWLNGPGACVAESRHRLILSGIALSVLLLCVTALSHFLRVHRRRREMGVA
jgi:hypothetical protein